MIRNYTSSVPADRSIMNIEQKLINAGATHIAKWYDNKEVIGVIFQIEANGIPLSFKLPSKETLLAQRFIREIRMKPHYRGYEQAVDNAREQARRTAWKLLDDWVAIQTTMIEIEQVEFAEVFMPYMFDFKSEKTFYELAKQSGFNQLQLTDGKR